MFDLFAALASDGMSLAAHLGSIGDVLAAAPTTAGAHGGGGGHGGAEPIRDLFSAPALIALVTLTILEIVLGIDNIIFISVLADKLPLEQQNKSAHHGLALAMILRILLLLSISWIMRLTTPVPIVGDWFTPLTMGRLTRDRAEGPAELRDSILLVGGLFLIYKATTEIHDKLEGTEHGTEAKAGISLASVITQILILDIVFSLDSVITAVGMVQTTPETFKTGLTIMITAVVIAVGVMLFAPSRSPTSSTATRR